MHRVTRKTRNWVETFIAFVLAVVIVSLLVLGAYVALTEVVAGWV